MKRVVSLSLVLLLGLSLVTGCGKKNKKDGTGNTNKPETAEKEEVKVNTNEDVVKDQELEVFKFENTSLVYDSGTSTLETSVTNTSNSVANLVEFRIHVMNGEEEIVDLPGYIGSSLAPGETRTISSSYGDDLSKATSIRYEIVR